MNSHISSLMNRSMRLLVGLAAILPLSASAGEVRFSPEDGHAYNPVWSMDGKHIAFEVNRYDGGSIDLFVSQVSGAIAKDAVKVSLPGGTSKFGSSGQVVSNPTWHPSGMSVFEGSNQGGMYRLYIKAPGGASATELLSTTQASGNLTFPTVSADGNFLAFVSSQTGNGDLRAWDRGKNTVTQLSKSDATESFPEYSADSKRMLFTRLQNFTQDIFEIDLATGTEKSLVSGNGDQTRATYSASGSVVYFTSERGTDQWDIAMADKAGGNKKVLAKDVRLPLRQRPALTPDGQWVAWVSADPTKDSKIMMAKLDGSKTVEVSTEFKGCGEPALTLQNGRVLLAFTFLPASGADWRHLFVMDVTDKL